MTHDEGTHVLQRVSTEKEQWQNRQWVSALSLSSTASALQGKADAFAVTTVENVITSQATVFAFLSLLSSHSHCSNRRAGRGVTTVTQSREISPPWGAKEVPSPPVTLTIAHTLLRQALDGTRHLQSGWCVESLDPFPK